MKDDLKTKLFMLLVSFMFVVVSLFIIPEQLPKIKDFKENFVKVECVVVDYKTHRSKDNGVSYSPIYSYTDKNGTKHELSSSIYTSKKPRNGKIKEIYINPEKPSVYYNGMADVILPIILFPGLSIVSFILVIFMLFRK